MVDDRVLPVVTAIALVVGLGMAASTLDSSIRTTPDDAIDFDPTAGLLGPSAIDEYKDRLQSGGNPSNPGSQELEVNANSGSSDAPGGDGGSSSMAREDGQSKSQGMGPGGFDQSWLDQLLALLRALLDLLIALIPVLIVGGLLIGGIANRDRIASFLANHWPNSATEVTSVDETAVRMSPANEIEHAWYEMAQLAGVDGLDSTTPRECASRVKAAGVDRSTVDRLTELFEEVTYGPATVTDERRTSARERLGEVRAQLGGRA